MHLVAVSVLFLFSFCLSAFAQEPATRINREPAPFSIPPSDTPETRITKLAESVRQNKQAFLKNLARDSLRLFASEVIDLSPLTEGKKPGDFPRSDLRSRLILFRGRVIAVPDDGLLFGDVDLSPDGKAFLKNFPDKVAAGAEISAWAMPAGSRKLKSEEGKTESVPAYDYGTTPNEKQMENFRAEQVQQENQRLEGLRKQQAEALMARIKTEAEKNRKASDKEAALLKFQKEQAESGLPSFQYDLAIRYLEGRGVQSDPEKAIEWLKESAANGNAQAQKKLQSLEKAR